MDLDSHTDEEKVEVDVSKKEIQDSPLLDETKVDPKSTQPEQIIVSERNVWERLAVLRLSIEEKAVITENILLEIEGNHLYWIQLVVSIVIATFGLLQNSVAVVIGAMLIAPLLGPIKGTAFGVTTGQSNYFLRSIVMLVMSIFVAVATAFLVSLLIPLKIETPEILARTSPNLLDLFIAIASGSIAILSLYFKKLSESISGVAMSAALMPPLAVIGIELALGNLNSASGATLLFATNLFAILVVGIFIFLSYGFFPRHKENTSRTLRIGAAICVLMLFISLPLFTSLTNIVERITLQDDASRSFAVLLEEQEVKAELSELRVRSFTDESVMFSGSVKVYDEAAFENVYRTVLRNHLSEDLQRQVSLELQIIPIVSIVPE